MDIEPAPVAAMATLVVAMAVVALATQHVPPSPIARDAPGIGLPTRASAEGGRDRALGPNERIDLTTASARDIERLPGVGQRLAQRIVEQRALGLRSLEDLDAVSGVGPRLLEKLAPHVAFGPAQRSNENPTRNASPSQTGPVPGTRSSGTNVARSSSP